MFPSLYLASDEDGNDPAGRILPGERYGLDLLLRHGHLNSAQQAVVLTRLRRIIHDNLIEFDPTGDRLVDPPSQSPRILDHGDVAAALFVDRPRTRPLPFAVVDRVYLSEQREKPKKAFVARAPEWRDVVHGSDNSVKFVERDQTQQLKEEVRSKLLEPVAHGTAEFPSLFACGPPGAGKSALVRRVAALLVEEGHTVVADAGLNLSDPPEELDVYCQQLIKLAETGQTVLLVLDDPLFEESGWIDLLHKLKRPGLRVSVLAATPRFLFDRFKNRLGKLKVHRFDVSGASREEKSSLARAFGRDEKTFGTDTDDFLVLSIEAAAGSPFDTIMDRLWITLNSGVPFGNPDNPINAFPWPLRAFLIVCFFHRLYLPCLEPLLKAALDLTGGTGSGSNVRNALEQMWHADGWKIFRLFEPERSNWAYQGTLITTNHQRIALRAWERRPAPCLDDELCDQLAKASIQVPQTVRQVGIAAARLATSSTSRDDVFVKQLISIWSQPTASPTVETRYLCEFVSMLQCNGCAHHARRLSDVLQARSMPSADGWLAALALWFLSSDDAKKRSFPASLDVESLVNVADFSIAPKRASQFANALSPSVLESFRSRLFQSFDGELPWKPDTTLLRWLMTNAPRASLLPRVDAVQRWLTDHSEDTSTRTQYLTFLLQLPKEKQFDDLRRQAAADTAQWLENHSEDTSTRTQYLTFLLQLPREESFDAFRRSAAEQTSDWLRRPDNEYATDVRTQFLSFLSKLSKEFDQLCRTVALETSEWLESHTDNCDVRAQYVSFVLDLSGDGMDELRQNCECHHHFLIQKTPSYHAPYYAYGALLLRLERYLEAADQFRESLKRHKGHQLAHRGLAMALHKLGQFDEAEREFRDAIGWAGVKKKPQAMFYTSLGWFYIERSRWTEAVDIFKQAQTESPEYFGNYWGIGKAMKELGNYAEAEKSLRKALETPDLEPPARDEIPKLLEELVRHRDSNAVSQAR